MCARRGWQSERTGAILALDEQVVQARCGGCSGGAVGGWMRAGERANERRDRARRGAVCCGAAVARARCLTWHAGRRGGEAADVGQEGGLRRRQRLGQRGGTCGGWRGGGAGAPTEVRAVRASSAVGAHTRARARVHTNARGTAALTTEASEAAGLRTRRMASQEGVALVCGVRERFECVGAWGLRVRVSCGYADALLNARTHAHGGAPVHVSARPRQPSSAAPVPVQ